MRVVEGEFHGFERTSRLVDDGDIHRLYCVSLKTNTQKPFR